MALRTLSFHELFSLHAVLDEECRPLGEHRAPSPLPGAAPTQHRTCPYPGSRHEHARPMNLSALKQTTKHMDEVLAGLSALRTWCRGDGGGAAASTLEETWRLTAGAAVLPAFLIHRLDGLGDSDAPLDAGTAVLYKACLGLKFLIEQRVLEELLARGVLDGRKAADELAGYSESSGWLVGVSEVCAATTVMIDDVLQVMVKGEGAPAVRCRLVEAVGAPAAFQELMRASWELYGLLLCYSTWSAWTTWSPWGSGRDGSETARLAAITAEDPPLQNRLSLTMGMRRISTALSALPHDRCTALLEGFRAVVSPAGDESLVESYRFLAAERDAAKAEAFVAARVIALEARLNAALGREPSSARQVDLAAYRAPARSAG